MQKTIFFLLIIGVIFFPMAVYGEGTSADTNATPTETEVQDNTTLEVANSTPNSVNLSSYLGLSQVRVLLASQGAMDYLLTANKSQKQVYSDNVAALKELLVTYKDAIVKDGAEQTVYQDGYTLIETEYNNLTNAADAMFASFEKEGTPVQSDVAAFEESVDRIFYGVDSIWAKWEESGDKWTLSEDAALRTLDTLLFQAVEEAYTSVLMGTSHDKGASLSNFDTFDKYANVHKTSLTVTEFSDIKKEKEDIVQAVKTMFATYEKDGKINSSEFASLETLNEKVKNEYMKVMFKPSTN